MLLQDSNSKFKRKLVMQIKWIPVQLDQNALQALMQQLIKKNCDGNPHCIVPPI